MLPVSANELIDGQQYMKKSVVKNGYVFEIQEVENDNGQIVRRYEKGGQKNQRSAGIEEAKALLLAMGLDEKIINSLPEEKLLCVAGSNFVQSAESYIKTGKDNSVVYLDKETALQEMSQQATRMGANAVIAVDLDYETVGGSGSMLMVTAAGTAVRYE